jgi:PilZ domain
MERRIGQRFPYLLPVSIRQVSTEIEAAGFTQDLSSRGVFLFTDAALLEGSEVELTLQMPSEITLGESMRVRCRGHVLRVIRTAAMLPGAGGNAVVEPKAGVAVRFDGYEYLPDSSEGAPVFARVSSLHGAPEEERPHPHGQRPVIG